MALAVLGVLVLVVAIIALGGPSKHSVKAGSQVPVGSRAARPSPTLTSSAHAASSLVPSSPAPSTGRVSTAARSSSTAGSPSSTATAVARQPLVVLNNTTITGLAQRAAERFAAGGWTVTKYANYQNDIISTCAYYDPSVTGAQAAALALQKQFPTIKRVEPQFPELATWQSPIVVILTPDYTP